MSVPAFVFMAAVGLAAGFAAALAHLVVTRWRARLALRRGPMVALATMPLGLAGPAAAVVLAARVSPLAACAVPFGILLGRALVLGLIRRRA